MAEKKIGEITHYFDKIGVGIIKLEDTLKTGDKVRFEGGATNFEQEITEMQVEHESIPEADAGQEIGVKVTEKVREGDSVILL